MNRLLDVAFAAVLSCALSPVSAAVTETGSLLRATIAVTDVDQSLTLFRDVLGLSVRRDLVLTGEAVNRILGTDDEAVRIVILQSGDSVIGNVAVLAYEGRIDRRESRPAKRSFETGDVALVMHTSDIDAVHAAVIEAGYPVISPPIVLFERPELAVQAREMMFLGPEGVAINLIQPGVARPAAERRDAD